MLSSQLMISRYVMGSDDCALMEEMEQGNLGCKLVRSKRIRTEPTRTSRFGSALKIRFSFRVENTESNQIRFYFWFRGLIYPNQTEPKVFVRVLTGFLLTHQTKDKGAKFSFCCPTYNSYKPQLSTCLTASVLHPLHFSSIY